MHRIAAIVLPIIVGFGASAWLYGWPGPRQRLQAPRLRHHIVFSVTVFTMTTALLAFVTRGHWVETQIWSDAALSLFLGLIVVSVALLFALLPPQSLQGAA